MSAAGRGFVATLMVLLEALTTAYGPLPDGVMVYLAGGIRRVAESLEAGNIPLAMIKAVQLGFPEIEADNLARMAACDLVKYNHKHRADNGQFDFASGGVGSNIEEVVVTAKKPKTAVDRKFIERWEGQSKTAYVPDDGKGNVIQSSGVTVGMGVDLGAQKENELREAGVSSKLMEKLDPYLGKQGKEAQELLKEKGAIGSGLY